MSQSVTKTDVRSYLAALYGVQTHGRLHRAWNVERRMDAQRQVVSHVQARSRRAHLDVLLSGDARGHVQGGARGVRAVVG